MYNNHAKKLLASLVMGTLLPNCAHQTIEGLPGECELTGDLVLSVSSHQYMDTDIPSTSKFHCIGEQKERCFPWETWMIFESDVNDVLAGVYPMGEVRFAKSMFALFTEEALSLWFVSLEESTDEALIAKLGTKYIATDFCFGDQVRE